MITRRQLVQGVITAPFATSIGASLATLPVMKKVLLDTDIGSDIDDAVALAYLLRKPECHLLGITTVTGDAYHRARLASALCDAAGKKVPIHAGHENPLVIEQRQTHAPQAEKLKGGETPPQNDAVEFLRRTIRQHPGEVTLLAVGPFTNIAVLFQTDPDIPALLKQLVIMGGKYSDYPTPWGPTEWNAIVDPHATAIVLNSAAPVTMAYGLDITWQVSMSPAETRRRFQGDALLEIVLDWSEVWFRDRELLHFHDPLAAAALFTPDICTYDRGTIDVDLTPGDHQGVTRFHPDAVSHQQVAATVNADAFFNEYFSVFNSDRRAT